MDGWISKGKMSWGLGQKEKWAGIDPTEPSKQLAYTLDHWLLL